MGTQLKPGDEIEWVYHTTNTFNGKVVTDDECLWSSIEKRYVPIGGPGILLIAISDKEMTWLHPKGCFRASRYDSTKHGNMENYFAVRVFRARRKSTRETRRPDRMDV